MAHRGKAKAQGQVRQSQMIMTCGPGALLDLPKYSVMVAGLDYWEPWKRQSKGWSGPEMIIHEERLEAKIKEMLGLKYLKLCAPPIEERETDDVSSGVTVWIFPQWFVAQYDIRYGDQKTIRSRPLVHLRSLLDGMKYLAQDKKKYPVVPIRFVQSCPNGHISDIDWPAFVHQGADSCKRPLWIDERGNSGDFSEIFIRCECGQIRPLTAAVKNNKPDGPEEEENGEKKLRLPPLGFCQGNRPWMGMNSVEACLSEQGKHYPNRLLVRTATNAYFPQTISAIHIPDRDADLRKAVDSIWEDFLQYTETEEDLQRENKKAKVQSALEGFSLKKIWAEIQRRKQGGIAAPKSIKEMELETLLECPAEFSRDVPYGDFFARTLSPFPQADPLSKFVDKIVLVHRLREVRAQIGFTRLESMGTDIDGELTMNVRLARLAEDITWLPACENHGEGFFVSFNQEMLEAWLKREAVQERLEQLEKGHEAWQKAHPNVPVIFPGPRYIMLHSLSHLLITAVALECGYPASSIRERIYVGKAGCGILLFTGSPDAEGTLGGLVEVGRHLPKHLRTAIELGRLCSNDPVCAQHRPDDPHKERFQQGAACHGCLLISESSCERQNAYLDRMLVVETVEALGAEFFVGI